MLEIERTYLVKNLPADLGSFEKKEIKQGWFSDLPSPLRIRQTDDRFELTKKLVKAAGDFSTYEENNLPIKLEEFERLWPHVVRSLVKTRYLVPLADGLKAELDVFHGKLEGLAFVEVEFTSREQMTDFEAPGWFGNDVTNEEFSANWFLAGLSFDEVKGLISAKGFIS